MVQAMTAMWAKPQRRLFFRLLFGHSQAASRINTRHQEQALLYVTCVGQGRVLLTNSTVHQACLNEKESLRMECPSLGIIPWVKEVKFYIWFHGNERKGMWQDLEC